VRGWLRNKPFPLEVSGGIRIGQKKMKICVVGLGYVGLPLAIELSKHFPTIGIDTNEKRISELLRSIDRTNEISAEELSASRMSFSCNMGDAKDCNFYIVTVPTPIDKSKKPDLSPLKEASEQIACLLSLGDIVVYESTVYPGVTEEICGPILEKKSNLKLNQDFFLGYSPERINPGDKTRKIQDIVKITSGSTEEAATKIDAVYKKIIRAGTYRAPSIKVAEAAKVIENTQRDVNIALINELAIIFSKLNLDTEEVLKAAGSKWNFLKFWPGLVGGHCIGVDPYYLAHKSLEVGHQPELILAGRRINDSMHEFIAGEFIKKMSKNGINIGSATVLIMGITFKENCPDVRNSKVIDVIKELEDYGVSVTCYDPILEMDELYIDFKAKLTNKLPSERFDGIIFAVAHDEFRSMDQNQVKTLCLPKCIIYDMKYIFEADKSDMRL
jgi:UDP-N-acetyl-D-galactosamine dehydrogenase